MCIYVCVYLLSNLLNKLDRKKKLKVRNDYMIKLGDYQKKKKVKWSSDEKKKITVFHFASSNAKKYWFKLFCFH